MSLVTKLDSLWSWLNGVMTVGSCIVAGTACDVVGQLENNKNFIEVAKLFRDPAMVRQLVNIAERARCPLTAHTMVDNQVNAKEMITLLTESVGRHLA